MALEFLTGSSASMTSGKLVTECINKLGGSASISNTIVTFSGLFDDIERSYFVDDNKSFYNMRFWYDMEKKFSIVTKNPIESLKRYNYDGGSDTYFYKVYPWIVTTINDETYYLPGMASSNDTESNAAKEPFYCGSTSTSYSIFEYSSIKKIGLYFSGNNNTFTLIPLVIGSVVIPNLYYCIDNYANAGQIVKIGTSEYKCLDSCLFYKIT